MQYILIASLVGKAIEELFNESGFDSGEFQTVLSSPL
jgi:hypothetical protein